MSDRSRLAEQLLALGARRISAREPVNVTQIRQFCDAIEDDNPLYRDAGAARRHGHGGQVAPPAMLHCWTMPPLRRAGEPTLLAQARDIFGDHGFDAVIATNYAVRHDRYFAVGEQVVETVSIEEVSDLKATPVGVGHFLSTRHMFAGADGAVAATLAIRVYHFRRYADGEGPPPLEGGKPTPVASGTMAGAALPPLSIDITPTLIVGGAIGSNDYERVHHDVPLARAQGLNDIIMNILTTTGLVSRYVTDWAGPRAMLRSIALTLKAPNYPGDRMTLTGMADGPRVSVTGRNGLGKHVVAEVEQGERAR